MKKISTQLIWFVIQLSLVVVAYGGITNWFRSGADLISGLFFIMYLVLSSLLIIPTHIHCFVKKTATSKPAFVASLILFLVTAVFLKTTTGKFLPLNRVAHSLHRTFIDHAGEEVQYWVEFKNPFHESHTEYLVLAKGNDKTRIQIVAKEDAGPYFYGSKTDDISIVGSNLLLRTEFEADGSDRFFLIDPRKISVISNWIESAKTESNQGIDPTLKTPVESGNA